MNQDGYFEQALMMRNLLQEFVVDSPAGCGGARRAPVTIVGFPEHIFTQSSGFVTASAPAPTFLRHTLASRTFALQTPLVAVGSGSACGRTVSAQPGSPT
eukprot:3950973-Prymnesium_polylepis.1